MNNSYFYKIFCTNLHIGGRGQYAKGQRPMDRPRDGPTDGRPVLQRDGPRDGHSDLQKQLRCLKPGLSVENQQQM